MAPWCTSFIFAVYRVRPTAPPLGIAACGGPLANRPFIRDAENRKRMASAPAFPTCADDHMSPG